MQTQWGYLHDDVNALSIRSRLQDEWRETVQSVRLETSNDPNDPSLQWVTTTTRYPPATPPQPPRLDAAASSSVNKRTNSACQYAIYQRKHYTERATRLWTALRCPLKLPDGKLRVGRSKGGISQYRRQQFVLHRLLYTPQLHNYSF